jgi:hypothetical protein
MEPIKLFIGYDRAESIAYHAMVQSVINTASVPVSITPVKLSMLPMYTRERDPRQSNEFSFSRFLVPYLCGYQGMAIFMDCDMMFRADIKELAQLFNPTLAVQVVQHDYEPKDSVKYLGAVQYKYPRKNWSSAMMFNCSHYDCRKLTPDYINTADSADLHRFAWTQDRFIGALPVEWNHLVGEYQENQNAKNVHWTVGGPWFREYMAVEHSDEWRKVRDEMQNCLQMPEVVKSA